MKRTVLVAAIVAALIAVPTAADADPGTTITGPATAVAGTNVTVNVSGPVTITEQGAGNWDPTGLYGGRTTGACTATVTGSYTSGGQVLTVVCTGPGTLSAQPSQTFTLNGSDGQALTVTVTPAPVVTPPPPAPAPVILATQTDCAGTYRLQLTNTGNADLVGGTFSSSYCTPPNLAAVMLPAGATVTYRTTCNRYHRCYIGVGFTVRGLNIPVGANVAVSFVVA